MNESADLVMYWWDRAAELLTAQGHGLKRFGFVTTNSITPGASAPAVERHLRPSSRFRSSSPSPTIPGQGRRRTPPPCASP
jgi:hypothetical protein